MLDMMKRRRPKKTDRINSRKKKSQKKTKLKFNLCAARRRGRRKNRTDEHNTQLNCGGCIIYYDYSAVKAAQEQN